MQLNILVVEDDGLIALAIERKLENLGYNVLDVVHTGEAAVQKATTLHPDLILMDIMLAGRIDGITAAQQILAQVSIPVVYLTAYSDPQTVQRAKLSSPFGYLLKPFEEKDLQIAVEMAFYKHQAEKQLRQSEQLLLTTLCSIGDGVITTDAQGLVTFMNPVAEGLIGQETTAVKGHSLTDVFVFDSHSCLETMAALHQQPYDCLMGKNGRLIPIEHTTTPIQNEYGQVLGHVLIFRDVSQRYEAEIALQQAHDELEQRVISRTAELSQANLRLEQQTDELSRSNRDLEQFAYVVSHDLREPLRKIKSYAELLQQRYQTQLDEKADKYIFYVTDGASRLQALIGDLLAYSRIGKGGLHLHPTDLQLILTQVLSDCELTIRDTNATITCSQLPTLMVDPKQISQLFYNLISNGLKFQQTINPQIHIWAEKQEQEWLFGVRDNGIGIEPQYAEKIFVIFQRLHTKEEYPGTGIGLAICKKVIENHKGRIWVESQPGQGTTFYFTLPDMGA